MSVLTGTPRTATIRATTDLVVASVTREKLTPLLKKNPEVEDAFTKYITLRSQETKDALEKVDRYREMTEVKGDTDVIRSMIRRLFRI
jgi:CRP-like cAMP-binding protein